MEHDYPKISGGQRLDEMNFPSSKSQSRIMIVPPPPTSTLKGGHQTVRGLFKDGKGLPKD
jgi:hypothetical protein